jgi:Coenzyme PQQ synthesis protein D (PqqD)
MIERSEGWVLERLGNEVVMLDLERDRYLRLNRTGSLIWNLLEQPATIAQLAARLSEAERIPAERAQADTRAFVKQLVEHGAVRGG